MNPQQKTLAGVVGAAAAAMIVAVLAQEESSGKQYLSVYIDSVGVPTVCDGLTRDERGRPFKLGQRFTPARCVEMQEHAYYTHAKPVMDCVPGLKGRVNQTVAAVSLAYNIGPGAFCKSTVAKRFRAGDWVGGCNAFLAWNRGGGRVIRGLTLRRQRERALCLKGL